VDAVLSYLLYEAAYLFMAIVMNVGFSARTRGRTNVPPSGPVLIVANHQSFLDPAVVGIAIRRHLCFLARKTLFRHRAFAWLIRHLNAVPVDQEGVGIGGLRTILHQLKAGQAVVVFPEGHRTADGKLQELKPGVHLLIEKARAPIVPVGIAGTFDAWPRWSPVPIPAPLFLPAEKGTIAVCVGKPLSPDHFTNLPRDQALALLAGHLAAVQQQAEKLRRRP